MLYGFVLFKDIGTVKTGAEEFEEPVHDGSRLDTGLMGTTAVERSGLSRLDLYERAELVYCTGFNRGFFSFVSVSTLMVGERSTYVVYEDEFHILWLGEGNNRAENLMKGNEMDVFMWH